MTNFDNEIPNTRVSLLLHVQDGNDPKAGTHKTQRNTLGKLGDRPCAVGYISVFAEQDAKFDAIRENRLQPAISFNP